MHKFNFKLILKIIGIVICIEGLLMLTAIPFGIHYSEKLFPILLSSIITVITGFTFFFTNRKQKENIIEKKEAYLIVSTIWIFMALAGALPYYLSGSVPSYTDAFFESISGFTTSGASILTDIESLPKNILFWRSMTHWIGGMGIIVLAVAILPFFGFGGMKLFQAEVPGPTKDKIHPKVKETAKRLWAIYCILTFTETILLQVGGMNFFEAICHSFGTIATGGFSPKNTSVGSYSPYIQYVISFFMILAGTNFVLYYWIVKKRFYHITNNSELKFYLSIILIGTAFISFYLIKDGYGYELAFRESLFQVSSIVTCTGFATTDYMAWPPVAWMIIFLLMFSGGMAGSTAGGLKTVRHLLLMKNSFVVMRRKLHPNAVLNVRMNKKIISQEIIDNVLAIFAVYIFTFVVFSLIMTTQKLSIPEAMSAVATTMGGIGPGLFKVGPAGNFSHIPDLGKYLLCFTMLAGRLEFFTLYIVFTKSFWKN